MRLKDIDNGCMKIPSEWYRDTTPKKLRAYAMIQWLVMNANMDDSESDGVALKRGQVAVTIPALSKALGLTEKQTRSALNEICTDYDDNRKTSGSGQAKGQSIGQAKRQAKGSQKGRQILRRITNKLSVLTICNYDEYVCLNFDDNTETSDERAVKRAGKPQTKWQSKGQSIGQAKEEENEEKESSKEKEVKEEEINASSIDILEAEYKIIDYYSGINNNAGPRTGPRTREERSCQVEEVEAEEATPLTWRDDFQVYVQSCRDAWVRWTNDDNWMTDRRKFNPGVDIKLTLEKACKEYWATEAAWKHKKRSKSKTIDWKRVFEYAISQKFNRVYETRGGSNKSGGLNAEEVAMLERIVFGSFQADPGKRS